MGGIPPAPRGVPQIKVTFNVDTNGVLSVDAKDTKNESRSHRITIESRGGTRLTEDELQEIIKDDEKRKTIQSKNDLENYSYQIRNTCDDQKFNISENDKEKVSDLCRETINWIDNNPSAQREEYEAKRKELEDVWKPIISAAYGQQQGAAPNMNNGDQQSFGDDNANHSEPKIDEVD